MMIDLFHARLSIKQRLTALMTFGAVIILFFAFFTSGLIEFFTISQRINDDFSSLAGVMGRNCGPAVASNNKEAVAEIISALSAEPDILTGRVYAAQGSLLAEYPPSSIVEKSSSSEMPAGKGLKTLRKEIDEAWFNGFSLFKNAFHIVEDIFLNGRQVGTVYLQIDSKILYARINKHIYFCMIVFGLSVSAAYLFFSRLQYVVTRPLLEIVDKMKSVLHHQGYSVRQDNKGGDDISPTIHGFNGLLDQLQLRDQQFDIYQENLEEAIALRTDGLLRANKALEQTVEELTQARDAAEAAGRAKSQFLANMSHEIRTLMNGALGMINLLWSTNLNEKQRNFCETASRSSKALLNIINDILDHSKIEAGKLILERIDFNLRQAVEETVAFFSEPSHKKGLELIFQIDEEVPGHIRGDPVRLRQILTNLISNAVKFTNKGEVMLHVSLVEETNNKALLGFEVRDTGIGIAVEDQKQIFDFFSQANRSITRKFGGTGLGLAISKQLAEMMDGEIGLKSKSGVGTTFWFTAWLEKEPVRGGRAVRAANKALEGLRILIVDDNAANCEVLYRQALSWGMYSGVAESGMEGLRMLRSAAEQGQPYDLALLDLDMPAMDGMELAQTIKADPVIKDVRLLMAIPVTRDLNAEELQKKVGALCIRKPLRSSQLYECLTTIMAEAIGPDRGGDNIQDEWPPLNAHILLAEDNSVNQVVATNFLKSFGCSVEVVENGLQAIEAFSKGNYDLVLMDCQMPEMDGLEATTIIREKEAAAGPQHSSTPIVALTANAMEGDREKCLAAGMVDYLSKPFTQDNLYTLLARWIQRDADIHLKDTKGNKKVDMSQNNSRGTVDRVSKGPDRQDSGETVSGLAAIDLQTLNTIQSLHKQGQPGLLREVVQVYFNDSLVLLENLRKAVYQEDLVKIKKALHSFKSSSANVGALRLASLCNQLEDLKLPDCAETIDDMVFQIEAEYELVCLSLDSELQKISEG